MADLLPPEIRGRYFGMRNRITSIIGLLFSFVAAGLLQLFTGNTRWHSQSFLREQPVGRLISTYGLSRMSEPHPVLTPEYPAGKYSQNRPEGYFQPISDGLSFLLYY